MPVKKIAPVNLGKKSEVDRTAQDVAKAPPNELQDDIVREIVQHVQGIASDHGETLAYQFVGVSVGDIPENGYAPWRIVSNQTRKQLACEIHCGAKAQPRVTVWFINRMEMAVFYKGWLCVSIGRTGKAYWVGGEGVEINDLMMALRNA